MGCGSGDREPAVYGQDRAGDQIGSDEVADGAGDILRCRDAPGRHAGRRGVELGVPLLIRQEGPPWRVNQAGADGVYTHGRKLSGQRRDEALDRAVRSRECGRPRDCCAGAGSGNHRDRLADLCLTDRMHIGEELAAERGFEIIKGDLAYRSESDRARAEAEHQMFEGSQPREERGDRVAIGAVEPFRAGECVLNACELDGIATGHRHIDPCSGELLGGGQSDPGGASHDDCAHAASFHSFGAERLIIIRDGTSNNIPGVTQTRPPGRPRSEASRQAILTAALELVADAGYARLTIEGIAARAGVGKQTIYRWWPTKGDILLEAGAVKAELHVPVTDHGSYEADLRAFLKASYRLANHPQLADLLRAIIAEAQINPEFGTRFRHNFLERRRDALATITNRARERGDLPDRPDPTTIADIVFGTIWYRVTATRQPLDSHLIEDLLATLAHPRRDTITTQPPG